MAEIRKNPEAGKNPEKLQKSGIFPENPEHLASLLKTGYFIYDIRKKKFLFVEKK